MAKKVTDKTEIEALDRKRQAMIYNQNDIKRYNLYRQSKDVGGYKVAVQAAETWQSPQRYLLYQIYRNIEIDAHLTSCVEQRKGLILSKEFYVVGQDGKVNEEKTKLIKNSWFKEFVNLALDSEYWGHSLIQFGDIVDDKFKEVCLVPRHYVKPELHIVTDTYTDLVGRDYLTPPWNRWTISIGDPYSLGLYLKAAPLIIWKQAALGAWADYQESYGSPFRYLKTNVRDEATRQSGVDMMADFGANQYGVFDIEDEVQFLESNKQDAHNVFNEMIKQVDSQISKLILNQTGTSDEKSFTGSAEVHERVLMMLQEKLEDFIENVLNDQLVPFMRNLGLDIGEGNKIEASESEELSTQEKGDIAIELIKSGKYKISPEDIEALFGLKVEEVEPVDPKTTTSTAEKLKNLYS